MMATDDIAAGPAATGTADARLLRSAERIRAWQTRLAALNPRLARQATPTDPPTDATPDALPPGPDPQEAPPRHPLMGQFFLVSVALLIHAMLALGLWVSSTIENQAKHHAAAAAALYIDHFIAPFVSQPLVNERLSAQQDAALDHLTRHAASSMRVVAIKVWTPDGRVLYSTDRQLVGQRFVPSAPLRLAASGTYAAEFNELDDGESRTERAAGVPLIEIYVPVRAHDSRVVAVVEFYENAEALYQELARTKRNAWLVTGAICLLIIAGLSVIFARASNLIHRQRRSLMHRLRELSQLLRQNSELQARVERASRLAAEENERYLLSLGADLHDGPAQMIGYALLRLDALHPTARDQAAATEVTAIRGALNDAMNEVRNICAGLSMPEIENLSLAEALASTVRDHERRTRTIVHWDLSELPASIPHFVKVSLCRFVQEGLTNAFRHAGGKGQQVMAWADGDTVFVRVEDSGPGMAATPSPGHGHRLGLAGLGNRIESWGGAISVTSAPGKGTQLMAAMPITVDRLREFA